MKLRRLKHDIEYDIPDLTTLDTFEDLVSDAVRRGAPNNAKVFVDSENDVIVVTWVSEQASNLHYPDDI